MARTAKQRSPKREIAKATRLRVQDELETSLDWTPAELRVHPRTTKVEIREGGSVAAGASISEWGTDVARIDGTIHLSLTTATKNKGKVYDAELCDPITAHQLDLIIEALVSVRARAREIGILPLGD